MKPSTSLDSRDLTTAGGIPVFVEASHALPLVDLEILVRRGALTDPAGREGLSRMTMELLRRGPKGVRAERFDEELDRLGATLGVSAVHETVRIQGSVLARNLPRLLGYVGHMLTQPGLRGPDLARIKRQSRAKLIQLEDHDRSLAARAFRQTLFGKHPYGRTVLGSASSIDAITRDDVAAHHELLFRQRALMVGFAGDVDEAAVLPMVEDAFGALGRGALPKVTRKVARPRKGVRILAVDKPKRTQTQLYVGTIGIPYGHPDQHALLVANTAFGGTFTSRLTKAVRSERGWSYGASSKLGTDRLPEAWAMWTHPGATQLVDCLALQLELYRRWIERGLSKAEVARAKRFLVKGHAFDVETAPKRLDLQLEAAFYGVGPDWNERFVDRVRAVSPDQANGHAREHLSSSDLAIGMVATRTPELDAALRALPGVSAVKWVTPSDLS